jgi:hypothetical protein
MKKIIIPLIFILFLTPLKAEELNVLIDSRRTLESITFLENYAIVINKDHYYGPFSKDNMLQVEIFDKTKKTNGEIRLWVNYEGKDANGKKTTQRRDLGRTSQRIDIVRAFENEVDFSKTVDPETATEQPIEAKDINFAKLVQNKLPFFRYNRYNKNSENPSWVEFTGPLSLYVRGDIQDSFYMVEAVPLEDYLLHVINCEMREAQNLNAYKAQAILARTYALYKLEERNELAKKGSSWINYQIQGNQSDQSYVCKFRANNSKLPDEKAKQAIAETKDLVLKNSNNKLIDVHYQAHCGTCSTCKAHGCSTTKNGLGCCQEKLIYYAKELKYSYEKILKSFYPNAKISSYSSLGDNPVELNELEQTLMNTEQYLQQKI